MKRKNNHPLLWTAAVAAVLFLFPATLPDLCADTGKRDPGAYRYDPEGKPDPFKPFIEIVEKEKKTGQTQKTDEPQEDSVLPPLQRFSVDEFRLTGILWTADKKIAIVKTPQGKRYTLRRGTRLGINGGRVMKILRDSVVVVEKIKDFSGTVHTERVILALKKNGGNP
ncbi:MAG: pilus assembly protein PilP [Deltaproteobacteria bacterium]|nr:pilus assembly protein PilP [Deltaproteobacteria bacterium]MBW2672626.1 pilus assembly protein PilP [Deltaproteobacteria bacterium]